MQERSTNPIDYDRAPIKIAAMSKEFPAGSYISLHTHQRAQLIYATQGAMEVATEFGLWLVPPQRAVWIPAGTPHEMRARGNISLRTLYIRSIGNGLEMPEEPISVAVSGLLRELILRAIEIPLDQALTPEQRRILDMIPDEIRRDPDDHLHLAQPRDRRLKIVCRALIDEPGDKRTLSDWGQLVGASSRTLARLFQIEFGISFVVWRQQLRAFAAVPRLVAGDSISNIAADLCYETPSAFAAMFRSIMGVSPSQYIKSGMGDISDMHI